MDIFFKKFDKLAIFLIAYTLIFIVFFKTLKYTLPFVIAIIFTLLLYKPTKYIVEKFKIKNTLASLLVTLLFYMLINALNVWLLIILTSEMFSLGKNLQSYITVNQDIIYDLFNKAQTYFNNLDDSVIVSIRDNLISSISNISMITVAATGKLVSFMLSLVSLIPYIFLVLIFSILSTYLFMKEFTDTTKTPSLFKSSDGYLKTIKVFNESRKMLSKFVLSYSLIIGVTFIETLIGFSIINVKYTFILSILSAILDILPILGIGTLYIPLAIIYFVTGNFFKGIFIISMYLIVTIVRNIIEPKIVSSTLGIPPIQVLVAIFVGLQAYGFTGMFFCMFLVVFYNIFKKQNIL